MAAVYTVEQVAKHNSKDDLWICIHGKVYDVTHYLEDHPGGVDSLMEVAGQDGTITFEDLGHSPDARETMERFCIGKLDRDEEDLPRTITRNLAPVQQDEASRSLVVRLLLSPLTEICMMTVIIGAGFAAMGRFTQVAPAYHVSVPASLLKLLPWTMSVSLISYFSTYTARRLFPPHQAYKRPSHFKIVNSVARPSTNYAILDPRKHVELPIVAIEKLSPNTNKITLSLPTPNSILGLPVGQHIAIRTTINDAPINRSYTPTSSNKDAGRLELVIKNYNDGLLTGQYLKNICIGDKLSISGPRGQMRYRRGLASKIIMIAGGTGITPLFQLIRAICEDPKDDTSIELIYANQQEVDILLKPQIDNFARSCPEQLHVEYLLSRPGQEWTGGVGRCTKKLIQQKFANAAMRADDKDNKIMICGPQGMVETAKSWLVELGYDPARPVSHMTDQVFVF